MFVIRERLYAHPVYRSSCTVSGILVLLYLNLNLLDRLKKNAQISNFIKFRQFGPPLVHAYGQMDLTKLIVAFRSLAKSTEK